MSEDNKGTPLPEDQNSNPGNQDDNIPDWMKDAGWGKDSGTFDESKPIFDDMEGDDEEIVPADIPAWLEDAVPDGFSVDPDATPAFEGLSDEGSYITTGDLMPRTPPEEVSPSSGSAPSEPVPPEPELTESEITEEPITDESESILDIPSWLKNLEMDEDSQETAVAWLENMPEDLRATDEELAASRRPIPETTEPAEPETLEPPVDELAWIDEIASKSGQEATQDDLSQAELSEDLVASELIPEQSIEDPIFGQEEIQSLETEAPDWLQELADDGSDTPAKQEPEITEPQAAQESAGDPNMMPDWLTNLGADEPSSATPEEPPDPAPQTEPELTADADDDIPDWLGEFEASPETQPEDSFGLQWMDSVENKAAPPVIDPQIEAVDEEPAHTESADLSPEPTDVIDNEVSPLDETLNTQVPDWLSKIGETEDGEEPRVGASKSDFDDSASWLDEIDKPIEGESAPVASAADGEVMDWLENMDEKPEEAAAFDDIRDTLTGELEVSEAKQEPVELESAKFFKQDEEEDTESMPDWLSEIAGEDANDPTSLESAIRQSDHSLSDEEKDFLSQSDEKKDENADWLAKLDLSEDETSPEPELPAIKVDLPDEDAPLETTPSVKPEDSAISGGILDRLDDLSETEQPEVPQWLENLKKEEDPQETAILWLKQFVERGNEANLQDEIKRYTDELNPGDAVPKWMEDLKHEEDPQTTAMLWLEKLAGEGPAPEKPAPPKEEVEDGWLAELEKEASEQPQEPVEETPKDFQDTSDGWLEDLEIDEKLQSEDPDLPDWSGDPPEKTPEEGTPAWMKATSPLEGDFNTDELAGNAEKEVEIPAWLAGYGEGEGPDEETPLPPPQAADDKTDPDEYAWVSDTESPAPQKQKEAIDLNKAAISQLESILGISYQVAQGIVKYREKQGPFRDLQDLLNVPEISDSQTIEILKPEVFIKVVEEKPKPKPAPKPAAKDASFEERFLLAETLLAESQISEALAHYSFLIKKKKSIPQIIENLVQAAADNPVDISILKTLGDAYMRIDKLDDALAAYSKAEDLLQ